MNPGYVSHGPAFALTSHSQKHPSSGDPAAGVSGHLEAIARLPEGEQIETHEQIKKQNLTVKETEKVVQEKLQHHHGERRAGAPVGTKVKFQTEKAAVTLFLRRKTVGLNDVLEALDDAKRQAKEEGVY